MRSRFLWLNVLCSNLINTMLYSILVNSTVLLFMLHRWSLFCACRSHKTCEKARSYVYR